MANIKYKDQICWIKHLEVNQILSYSYILYFFSSGNHRRWRCSFIQHKNRYISMKCHKIKHFYHINLQWIFFFISLYKCTCFSFTISRTMILKISHDFYLSTHRYNLAVWSYDTTRSPKISSFMPIRY